MLNPVGCKLTRSWRRNKWVCSCILRPAGVPGGACLSAEAGCAKDRVATTVLSWWFRSGRTDSLELLSKGLAP
jgi:hypothetical protein